jgi:hypothetical protein
MRQIASIFWTLVVVVGFASTGSTDDKQKKSEAKTENKLVGTWKLVSAKEGGKEVKLPEGSTYVRHVTSAHFMWVVYDKDGKLEAALGGPYSLNGDAIEETAEYATDNVLQILKGKAQAFKWKVEANKFYRDGKSLNGLTIEEVWERVEKK